MVVLFRRKSLDRAIARREMAKIVIDLKQLHKRAFYYRERLDSKIKELEGKLPYIDDEHLRGSVLQNIRMYKNALKVVSNIEAALELLIVRLETLGLLGMTVKEMLMIKEVLKKLKGSTEWVSDLSLIAEDISERVGDLLEYFPAPQQTVISASAEAEKIIKEAEVIAKEKYSLTA
jgi:hypothetical protein